MSAMNQDCPKIRQHLALYAGRDLEEPLCVQVEQHIAGCGACREELCKTLAARERIGVFGALSARDLDAVDLWPGIRESWNREREAARSEVAALNAIRPRASRRRWLSISLAAAAVLVIFLRWSLVHESPIAPPIAHVPPQSNARGNVAVNTSPNAPVAPVVNDGSLRRAGPGEERLRDSSAPLLLPLRSWTSRAGNDTPNSLAGDDLR